MAKDRLFLIEPGFEAPGRDDGPFVCPFCNQIEGLLASFRELSQEVDVVRVPFPRPRLEVTELVGEANQALPLLIFGEDAPAEAKSFGQHRFIADTERILELLSERHGYPRIFRPAGSATTAKVA